VRRRGLAWRDWCGRSGPDLGWAAGEATWPMPCRPGRDSRRLALEAAADARPSRRRPGPVLDLADRRGVLISGNDQGAGSDPVRVTRLIQERPYLARLVLLIPSTANTEMPSSGAGPATTPSRFAARDCAACRHCHGHRARPSSSLTAAAQPAAAYAARSCRLARRHVTGQPDHSGGPAGSAGTRQSCWR
jgi:hypothetical protein